MTEINPKYVDGEPVCSGASCSAFTSFIPQSDPPDKAHPYGRMRDCDVLRELGIWHKPDVGEPCIPALRERIKELEGELGNMKEEAKK